MGKACGGQCTKMTTPPRDAKDDGMERELCRRQNLVLGRFLAIQAWVRGLNCIVLTSEDLRAFYQVERIRDARVAWIREDLIDWFPHLRFVYESEYCVSSAWFSRVAVPPGPEQLKAVSGAYLLDGREAHSRQRLRERDAIAYLAQVDCGLAKPKAYVFPESDFSRMVRQALEENASATPSQAGPLP